MIKEKIELIKSNKVNVTELLQEQINKIKSIDIDKNLNITLADNFENAINSSKTFNANCDLAGITVGYKDIFSTKGIETTAASNILKGYVPSYDSTVTNTLKEKGALTVAKLNCDAFAHGASGKNSDFGTVKNPYNVNHVAGGSSSGSGAAVALGLVDVATGTDTGGSLRNPANYTNTVAIKPTYGRVSRYGIIAMASSFDTVGHVTKTVEDNAIILEHIAGFDPYDSTSSKRKVENYSKNIKKPITGMKIGRVVEFDNLVMHDSVRKQYELSLQELEKQGAEIIEVNLPHLDYALPAYYVLVPSEVSSNLARFDGIRFGKARSEFGAEAKRRIMIGTYTLSSGYYDAYYEKAAKVRTLIINDIKDIFNTVDAVISPVTSILPPRIDQNLTPIDEYNTDLLTVSVNLAGVPALSVPIGFHNDLPIGVQIIGNYFEEAKLYQIGKKLEETFEAYKIEPKLLDNYNKQHGHK